MKLAIADVGDSNLDSNVFIESGSLTTQPPQTETPIPTETAASSTETPMATETAVSSTETPTPTATPSKGVSLSSVSPAYGLNDVSSSIYLYGTGFSQPLTVLLGNHSLTVLSAESTLITALVPAGLAAGFYDVTVNAATGSDSVAHGYEVVEAQALDDLLSSTDWLWTNPSPMRVGYTNSSVGTLVQHLGGQNTLDDVEVEFRLDSAEGEVLGSSLTVPLAPFAIKSTGPVSWEPETDGEYTICAIIDPNNEVTETDEDNNVTCPTLTVLGGLCDTTPPVVESFIIADDAPTTTDFDVTLDVTATDSGTDATGIAHVKFIEFEYILGAHKWVPVKRSDWIDYDLAQLDYPWTLVPTYGMRYMQAWAADNAGNISQNDSSSAPGVDVIGLLPSEQTDMVAQDGVVFYRFYVEAGQTLAATLAPVSGDFVYLGAKWRPLV